MDLKPVVQPGKHPPPHLPREMPGNPELPLNLEEDASMNPPGVQEAVPRVYGRWLFPGSGCPCLGGQRQLGPGCRLDVDRTRTIGDVVQEGRLRKKQKPTGDWVNILGRGIDWKRVFLCWHVRLNHQFLGSLCWVYFYIPRCDGCWVDGMRDSWVNGSLRT